MAVRPADLIAPVGRVETFLFPSDSADQLVARLQGYIADATGRSSPSDAATRSWAYYRAFSAVLTRVSALPQQVEVTDEGSHAYGPEQIRQLKAMADEFLAEWDAALSVVDAEPRGRPRGAVDTTISW